MPTNKSDGLVSAAELASRLHISPALLSREAHRVASAGVRVGARIRYRPDDAVVAWHAYSEMAAPERERLRTDIRVAGDVESTAAVSPTLVGDLPDIPAVDMPDWPRLGAFAAHYLARLVRKGDDELSEAERLVRMPDPALTRAASAAAKELLTQAYGARQTATAIQVNVAGASPTIDVSALPAGALDRLAAVWSDVAEDAPTPAPAPGKATPNALP